MNFNIQLVWPVLIVAILYVVMGTTASAQYVDIDILPAHPTIHEGSNLTITCYSELSDDATIRWLEPTNSQSAFQSVSVTSFPRGKSLYLGNAMRIDDGQEQTALTFMCSVYTGNNMAVAVAQRSVVVTIISRDGVLLNEDDLVVFPSQPIAQIGSNFTLTCIDSTNNISPIGWYFPAVEATNIQFDNSEMSRFPNRATITLFGVKLIESDPDIVLACLRGAGDASKAVAVQVVQASIPTTVPAVITEQSNHDTATIFSNETTYPGVPPGGYHTVPVALLLVAVAIGSGLAVFFVVMIFLSVYALFMIRSHSWPESVRTGGKTGKTPDENDDVFLARVGPRRTIDHHHAYQSVGDGEAGPSTMTSQGAPDTTNNKNQYAELSQYDNPRHYMRLSSSKVSSPKPAGEYSRPTPVMVDLTYDGVELKSFKSNVDSAD